MKDPEGANLDRVQVIKGWLGADGKTQEKIYDVKWAGDRKPGAERQAAAGRQHRRSEDRDLRQQHWRRRTDRRAGPIPISIRS